MEHPLFYTLKRGLTSNVLSPILLLKSRIAISRSLYPKCYRDDTKAILSLALNIVIMLLARNKSPNNEVSLQRRNASSQAFLQALTTSSPLASFERETCVLSAVNGAISKKHGG
jgi:hypothetical protein